MRLFGPTRIYKAYRLQTVESRGLTRDFMIPVTPAEYVRTEYVYVRNGFVTRLLSSIGAEHLLPFVGSCSSVDVHLLPQW